MLLTVDKSEYFLYSNPCTSVGKETYCSQLFTKIKINNKHKNKTNNASKTTASPRTVSQGNIFDTCIVCLYCSLSGCFFIYARGRERARGRIRSGTPGQALVDRGDEAGVTFGQPRSAGSQPMSLTAIFMRSAGRP